MITKRQNPLLEVYDTPYHTPPFTQIQLSDYEPAFQQAIEEARQEIKAIIANPETPSFTNTIEALDASGEKLNNISSIFFNLNSACTNNEMQAIAQQISPLLTEYSNSITMNPELFQRIKSVYKNCNRQQLTPEQNTLLENTYRMFIKGGANLQDKAQQRFREISMELSRLSLKFEENTLAATNAFTLHITDEADLSGLPEGVIETAAMTAKDKGLDGWLFSLHAPSYIPFMKYADKRNLREQMYRAYSSRCNQGGESDNNEIIRQMVNLRLEKAHLLGYKSYADYVLSDRMAETATNVNEFLEQLLQASHPHALNEKREVDEFARRNGFTDILQHWDWAYYSNKLKHEKYALDDEMLKPYFQLEKVQKGVFDLAYRLYNLTFLERNDIPKYHEDVRTYEVYRNNQFLAILYVDFFPRESKGGGAWMTEYRGQHRQSSKDIRPLVSIVMNFTKPTTSKPSLLTFDEVTTFLHEFGHSLHGMLSQCTYNTTSGTNVYRDFVELPSQIMENWALEKEWLDTWAVHYLTNEPIPQEYIDKIRRASNFQSGYQCDRQLSFGLVDMAWHSITAAFKSSVFDFETQAMSPTESFPAVSGNCFSTAFGHIFSGGYAAGYYSYKWAEVLDADAFSVFKTHGIFDKKTADSFRINILERGGSEHPMTLYKRFRGQTPTVDALLERSGLKDK